MKRSITILTSAIIMICTLVPHLLTAQTPDKMTYQAIVRDANDLLLSNQTVGMQISILQGSPTGTVVYTETQTPATNINGLISTEIGGGPDFNAINWTDGPYYLKTEFDPSGGTDYSISGTSQLLSTPYALHARVADSIVNGGVETDPVFSESVAFGISEADTANWNSKLSTEVDGDITNELQLLDIVGNEIFITEGNSITLPPETDPVFGASVAGGITTADTSNWNHHTDSTDIANMGYTAFMLLSQDSEGRLILSDNGATAADPAAILDIQSTTRGFLLPRMTYAEMLAITNPPTGLLVIESNTGAIFVRTSTNVWAPVTNDDLLEINRLNDAHSNQTYNSYYIGSGAGLGFSQSANLTTAVGSSSGVGFGEGDFNTAIGATAGPASGTQDLHNTTTIGYNSKAEYSHQVVLGTVNDTVIFPHTTRLKSQANLPTAHVGSLAVKDADSNLYYHNGNDWQQLNDNYKVGDFAMGGVIYYVDESGKHGLVCNLVDPDPAIRWSSGATPQNITYAEGDGIYAGEMNTAIAIAKLGIYGENSALQVSAYWKSTAPFATDYGDWYLPSTEELMLMYTNKDAINATINAEGWGSAIGTGIYWSSTENHNVGNQAYVVDFSSGNTSSVNKEILHRMRPIRKF